MENAKGIPLNCGSISGANAPTYIFKKPTAGGDKIQLSVQPFTRITSSSSSSNVVSYDATFLRSISAASITDYNTIVTKSDDIQSTSVYSLNSGVILGTISNGVASGVISGLSTASTYLVATAVGIPNCFSVASVNIDRVSSATIDSFVSYSGGTVAKNCYDAVNNRIAAKNPTISKPIFSTLNHASSTYVRNTGCWAYDLDLTCISPWNSAGGITMGGTLISPCHIAFANHYQISNGSKIRYVTSNNVTVEKTVIDQINAVDDIQIGMLDSDVPSSISFAKILPSNWSTYLPNLYRNTQYNSNSAGLPIMTLDYDKKASVMELHYIANNAGAYVRWPSQNSIFYPFLEMVIGGDSGSPSFLIVNNQLVLILTWTSSIAGPFYGGIYITPLNTAMNTLWTRNGRSGGSYTVTPIDLSGFTPF
jgi:hypothetical protein